jgi:predicted TIM-barrel fold metal-dependent hydrolase
LIERLSSGLARNTALLIDTHFHAFTRSLPLAAGARYQPQHDALLADLQAQWQAHDVQRGVIVQPSFLGTDNTYLLQLCEQFPQLLRGVGVIAQDTSPQALAQMHAQGMRGIRFNWVGLASSHWPDVASSTWAHVRRSLQALRMHVQLHVEGARLAQAVQCFARWQVPLVIDHLGRPDSANSLEAHAQLLQQLRDQHQAHGLFIKLSAPYRCGNAFAALSQTLLTTLGPQHLLWGSDWPFTQHEATQNYAAQIGALNSAVVDLPLRAAIMDTAQLLYFS